VSVGRGRNTPPHRRRRRLISRDNGTVDGTGDGRLLELDGMPAGVYEGGLSSTSPLPVLLVSLEESDTWT
jgi:hypothetical protein